jgi:ABC-type Mn2+/Zn2+ transport system ATPase subunit
VEIDITFKNYRCFPDSRAARIFLRKGFTAFVGINNSGKSSLLKFFYEFRSLFQMQSSASGDFIEGIRGNRRAFGPAPSILDLEELFCNANNRDLEIEVRFRAADQPRERGALPIPARVVLKIPKPTNTWTAELYLGNKMVVDAANLRLGTNALHYKGNPIADLAHFFAVFTALGQTLYLGPFRNAINVGANQGYFDIQVGQAFIRAWRAYKVGNVKRHNEAAIRLTEEIKHIFGFEDLQIEASADEQTLQVFINGKSYKLPELGSGLTQFILVLASAATRQSSYILIDEPELNLHPSLQLDFLTTLASYATEGILFGTQSIGLARASAERIYSLRKLAEGESEITELESTPRLSEFLGELSFSGYRELGFDKVLLVEGVTDVKTIQQFLRLHRKDHQIVVLPLGGTQLINQAREAELQEIKRISANVFAVIDSERTAQDNPPDSTRTGFIQMCNRTGITCHVLERRAIENYLCDRAVKQVMGEKHRALAPYEALRNVSPSWPKSENWRIAREMTRQELDQTDLGHFLAAL